MKKIIRFIICSTLCVLNFSFSFGQEIEWQNTMGGSDLDELYSIIQTSDGGYICGGTSASPISCDKNENYFGTISHAYDYWIVKLDFSGSIQWQKTIGGDFNDALASISQTSDGGYIVGGNSVSNISGLKTENCQGSSDYWIIKLDSAGNIQWQNTIGGNSHDSLRTIYQTYDGGYICGGRSSSNVSGDKTEDNFGGANTDYWIIKLDSVGNIQWQNSIGGSQGEGIGAVIQTIDGGYMCGGYSNSNISGDKTENSIGTTNSPDAWVVKLNSLGNIEWQKTIGGDDGEIITSIIQTFDKGFLIGAYSNSNISGNKTENNWGNINTNDYWIFKLDSVGNMEWDNTIGGQANDLISSICQTNDHGYLIGGTSQSNIGGDKTEMFYINSAWTVYGSDFWILKLDSLGNIQWQNTIGAGKKNILTAVTTSLGGGSICAGYSNSPAYIDKTEGFCLYSVADFWVIKLYSNTNLINGKTFYDLNSNFILDAGEPMAPALKITEQSTGRFSFSQQNGTYNVAVVDTGNFIVTPQSINNFIVTPVSQIANFSVMNQVDSLNDFAYQPISLINDLCVSITPTSFFRTGFNGSFQINYENNGTTMQNATLVLTHNSNMTYISSTVTPTNVTADSINWSLGNLAPLQSGSIIITLNVGTNLTVGSVTNSAVRIDPIINDANPYCNFDTANVTIRSSFDPNDILVSEDTLFTTQLPSQPWLDYTIRFQNTGNDTAFTVNVLNPIDTTKLELSSIEFVNSSHPVNLNWIPWERNMEFKFNNILLPDSNINEPLSHGFVHYRLKPKTNLVAGDSITNNAYIYFDFNAPVATNTAITRIVLPTGISNLQITNYDLKVFPNPAKNEITIAGYALQNNQPAVLKIYDVMGNEVYHSSVTTLNIKLKTLNFSSGVYFVQLQTGAKVCRVKFIKQ